MSAYSTSRRHRTDLDRLTGLRIDLGQFRTAGGIELAKIAKPRSGDVEDDGNGASAAARGDRTRPTGLAKRNLHIITISFNGPTQDPARRAEVIASAKKAMGFLKEFDAHHLVIFSPNRSTTSEAAFKASFAEQFGEKQRALVFVSWRIDRVHPDQYLGQCDCIVFNRHE